MFADAHLARVKAAFAAQFTPARGGYIFRRGQRGPAIPVSVAERDGFVAGFDRAIVRFGWAMVFAAIVALGALEIVPITLPEPLRGYEEGLTTGVLVVAFMLVWWWIRNAPARALERRAQIDQGVSDAEFRRASLVAMPWSLPVVAALFQVVLVLRVALFEPDPFGPQQRSYYAVAAVGLSVMAVIAWAKWRASR